MNLQAISLISSFLINIILSGFILFKAKKKPIVLVFALMAFSMSAISFGLFLTYYVNPIFIKIGVFGLAFTSTSFFIFSLMFPGQQKVFNKKYLLIYIPAVVFTILVKYSSWQNLDYGARRVPNFWYYPAAVTALLFLIGGIVVLRYKYNKTQGIHRNQISIITKGFVLAMGLFSLTNIIIPGVFGYAKLNGVGPLFLSLIPVFTAIAIFKYNFMDISVVIKKGFVFSLLIASVTFLYVFGVSFLPEKNGKYHILSIVLFSIVVTIGIPWLKTILENITDNVFFRKKIDYPMEISAINRKIVNFFEEGELIDYLVVTIAERFKLSSCHFYYLKDSIKACSYIKEQGEVVHSFVEYLRLFDPDLYLEKYAYIDSSDTSNSSFFDDELRSIFVLSKMDVCFPLYIRKELVAVLGLGQKLSGDMFFQSELSAFLSFTPHLQIVFEKLKLYEEKLEIQKKFIVAQKNAAIGELTKKLVHEIKNPLVTLSAFFQMQDSEFSPEELSTVRTLSTQSINRILKLIEDLSSFNRLTPKDFLPADINELIRNELGFLLPLLRKHKIESEFRSTDLPLVRIDVSVFRHAILNVMQNAVEAMSDGGYLNIRTNATDNGVDIIISDTGSGISLELQSKIFDPLVTTKPKGSGLGLAITSNIISEHKGSITVRSDAGQGTTFVISLPV